MNIDELEAKYLAATPGEWQHHMSHIYGPDPERPLICQALNAPWLVSDRDFIAAAHNAMPELIAAWRELQAIKEAKP